MDDDEDEGLVVVGVLRKKHKHTNKLMVMKPMMKSVMLMMLIAMMMVMIAMMMTAMMVMMIAMTIIRRSLAEHLPWQCPCCVRRDCTKVYRNCVR